MEPVFGKEAIVFLLASVSIPFVMIVLLSPLYEYVDRERSRLSVNSIPSNVSRIHSSVKNGRFFGERWIYYGSTEISICVLSATLLLAVSTSSKPVTYFFSNQPSTSLHTFELVAQYAAIGYILFLFVLLIKAYKRNNSPDSTVKECVRTFYATLTMLAPAIFYILFRMEWRIL